MPDIGLCSVLCALGAIVLAGLAWVVLAKSWIGAARFPRRRVLKYLQTRTGAQQAWRYGVWQTLFSSPESIRQRLILAGKDPEVKKFRRWQILSASGFTLAALLLCGWGFAAGTLNPLGATIMCFCLPLGGLVAPDSWLSNAAKQRQLQLSQELPDAIELLALAIGAGDSLHAAICRVAQRCTQVAGGELKQVVHQVQAGLSVPESLEKLRQRNDSVVLDHLVDAITTATEHGTPLAAVLHEQVLDSRSLARNQLLEAGGKKEVWMMIPVVFLILPLTVVFALYPGLVALKI